MPLVPFVVIDSHLSADCDGTGGQDTLQASRGERRGGGGGRDWMESRGL